MNRMRNNATILGILLLASIGLAADEPGQAATFTVGVSDGLVTIAADSASSNAILRELAGKAGFEFAVTAKDDRQVTIDLENASLETAIQRLSENYSIVFARADDGGYRVLKVTSGGAGAGAGEEADAGMTAAQVVEEIRRKNKDVKSFKGNMTMTMGMMGTSMEMKGSMMKGEGKQFRMDMDLPFMEGAKQIVVSDGEETLIWMPHMNMLQRIDNKRMEEELGPEIANMRSGSMGSQVSGLDEMRADSLRYVGMEELDGRQAYVLEGETKIPEGVSAMPFMPRSQKIWINTETGFPERAVYYNDQGTEMMSQRFTDVVTDPVFEGDPFHLDVPEGVQPIDITDNVIAMMGQMTKGSKTAPAEPSQEE